jgi:PAS domain S-box-containing protein
MDIPGIIMIFLSAIVMAVSLNHLFLAIKLKWQPLHLAIFLAGLSAASYFIIIYSAYKVSPDPEVVARIYRYHLVMMQASFLALLWAFSLIFGQYSRRWLTWTIISIAALMVISLVLPEKVLFSPKPSVSIAIIFGSGVNLLNDGVRSWRVVADISLVATIVLFIAMIGPQLMDKPRKDHIQLLFATGLLLLCGCTDHLTDFGANNMMYLLPAGYFVVYAMLSSHSLERMVDDLSNSAEALLEERKYKSFFHEVKLIVVELDTTGHVKYVNPFFTEMTGYTEREILGKDWFELIVPAHSAFEVQSAFLEILTSDFHNSYQNPIITKEHGEKMIAWYNVTVRDRYDKIAGSISLGLDISALNEGNQKLEKSLKEARELISKLQGPIN